MKIGGRRGWIGRANGSGLGIFADAKIESHRSHQEKCNLQKDLELSLEPARTALRSAIAGNPSARIQFM
jgi:hypothetical protein